jgi:hypothetical protein
MYIKKVLTMLISLLTSLSLFATEPDGSHTSKDWQIWAYSGAAPSFLGGLATVMGGNGEVLREGSNGWTCTATKPMPEGGFETPHHAFALCADDQGFKWASAYMAGTTPEMERDAYIWMLHGDTGEDNNMPGGDKSMAMQHDHWIESGPHLMLMPKDPSTIAGFSTDFTAGAPYQMFKGSPYAHLMIPFEDYYSYQPESAPMK